MRWRLIFSFLAVVVVAIISVIVIVRLDNENQVQSYFFRGGSSGAEELVISLEQYYSQRGSWEGIESRFASMRSGARMGSGRGSGGMMAASRVILADAKGKVLVDTISGSPGGALSQQDLSTAIQLKNSSDQLVGYLLIEGSTTTQRGDELPLISKLNDAAWRASLISLAIALVFALILAAGFIRPIRRLTTAVQRLASGDLSHRVEVKGKDEIATLGNSFNAMADSLQKSEARRREMTADIAHELRSPLAVQRAHLEALQDGVYPLTAETIRPIAEQNRLLERLVDDLRTLALADAGELRLEVTQVNLSDLLEGVLERLKVAADQKEISLSLAVTGQAGLTYPLDPDRMAQIMTNLVSNGLRHAPQDGWVKVSLDGGEKAFTITVQDNGEGIPAEALPYIFERFYRADHARSRDKGGSGLGLAIARQLAQAMGGRLVAANQPEGGAVFTLSFVFA